MAKLSAVHKAFGNGIAKLSTKPLGALYEAQI